MNTTIFSERFNPVITEHKAVRCFMFEVLMQVGALDVVDLTAIDRCVARIVRLFVVLREPAIELQLLFIALNLNDMALRREAAAELYQKLTRFVSLQLAAQQERESTCTPRLWAQHTDAELGAMRGRRLLLMSDGELAEALEWMEVTLTPQELAAVLNDVQVSVSASCFAAVIAMLGDLMIAPRWRQSAREFVLPDGSSAVNRRHESFPRHHLMALKQVSGRSHRAKRSSGQSQ